MLNDPRTPASQKNGRRRDLASLRDLSRKPVLSTAQKSADPNRPLAAGEEPPHRIFHKLKAFLPSNLWKWGGEYFKHRIGLKHAFKTYVNPAVDNGIYRVPNNVIVAMAGDWGTGTDEAAKVESLISGETVDIDKPRIEEPHITIHLGDVYYIGDEQELRENCLGERNPENEYDACTWPHGSMGSFALNGNHEMYARGMAYFDVFLPTLGIDGHEQRASFFCIENDYWRVIALDTGYNSVGLPVLELIPIISRIKWIGGECTLEEDLIEWLANTVRLDNPADDRALILLSHHQYYSAHDGREYPKPARQLAQYIKRPVLWFWGHEHRLAAYEAHQKGDGIVAIGRCIGHGGMPIDLDLKVTDSEAHKKLRFVDTRQYDCGEGITVGFNGFAHLTFTERTLVVKYVDLTGNVALSEEWKSVGGSPKLEKFEPFSMAAPAPVGPGIP